MKFVTFGVLILGTVCASFADVHEDSYEQLSRGINNFSNGLFEVIAEHNDFRRLDLVFSGLSTHKVMSFMALAHSEEVYYDLLMKFLHTEGSEKSILAGYKKLSYELENSKNVSMNMFSAMFAADKHKYLWEIIGTDVFRIPFIDFDSKKPQTAAVAINEWVDRATNHLITDVIADCFGDDRRGQTLVSAGYFEGDWKFPFNKYLTQNRDFHLDEDSTKQVPTMFMERELMHGELPEQKARFVKLPYKNEKFEMLIILPDEINGLESILSNLGRFNETTIEKAAKEDYVHLYLPKFKVASDTFMLDRYLIRLLDKEFERIGKNITEKIMPYYVGIRKDDNEVDCIRQKPFIEINEAGTTTKTEPVGWVVPSSERFSNTSKVIFNVNRPFYYQISYNGTILFQGATFFGA